MAFMKRVFLFLAVNVLVMVTINLILSVTGVRYGITARGIEYDQLMAFCLIWGMGGAFISLAISRLMAKWMMGVRVVDPGTRDPNLQALVSLVHDLARSAGLPKMPEVGIYDSPEVNAFATGPTKSRALVAVSTGLLQRMRRNEIEGVLGHEVAHIANGDMVTMTLVQGVVNAFVMFLARVIAFAVSTAISGSRNREEGGRGFSPMVYHLTVMITEMVLMILGAIVVAWFSRYREFRADAGGARLAGRDCMVSALQALRRTVELADLSGQEAVQTLKISGRPGGWLRLFASHPPLEERIARLEMMTAA